eukprot:scaffold482_cov247-Pinguiococcus_pyrenoidosus.AAC.38
MSLAELELLDMTFVRRGKAERSEPCEKNFIHLGHGLCVALRLRGALISDILRGPSVAGARLSLALVEDPRLRMRLRLRLRFADADADADAEADASPRHFARASLSPLASDCHTSSFGAASWRS